MFALIVFVLVALGVGTGFLWFFYKGPSSEEIKTALKAIFSNLKELFKNLKELFTLLTNDLQSESNQEVHPSNEDTQNAKIDLDHQSDKKEAKDQIKMPEQEQVEVVVDSQANPLAENKQEVQEDSSVEILSASPVIEKIDNEEGKVA